MAQIETGNNNRKHRGVAQCKKLSTRVDLTPMVDLGFLLITFFIFTTSLAQPVAMNLTMPDDRPTLDPSKASDKKTLTLILGKDDNVSYYEGIFTGKLQQAKSLKDVRSIIINKKQQVREQFHTNDVVVLMKATNNASYKDIVACLDEMLINDISHYMLLDVSAEELKTISAQ